MCVNGKRGLVLGFLDRRLDIDSTGNDAGISLDSRQVDRVRKKSVGDCSDQKLHTAELSPEPSPHLFFWDESREVV